MIVLENDKITIDGEEHSMAGMVEWSIDRDFRWDYLVGRQRPTGIISCAFKWKTPQGVLESYEAHNIPYDDLVDLRK